MGLRSELFRGDPQLEAAAVSNAAHIVPGATGEHVAKIQRALNILDGASLSIDGAYRTSTAAAVLLYKQRRNIVNRSYQAQADDIVGIMTMSALDNELLARIDPTVVIGRFAFAGPTPGRPFALSATTGAPSAATTAGVRAVVRGNPYVASEAPPQDAMPASVPPGKTYSVQVSVVPALTGTGDFIELSIASQSLLSGSATVSPTRVTQSTTVVVTGGVQTEPTHAGELHIEARANGGDLKATSDGFSVCAHPASMEDAFGKDLKTDTAVGIIVRVTVKSDSGRFEDMNKIEMSEIVEQFRKDQPPFKDGSGFVNNSGYESLIPPASAPGKPPLVLTDSHAEPTPDAGPKGVSEKIQLHIFKCDRCGAIDKVVPRSGFDIKHEVFAVGKLFKHRAIKVGEEVSIRPAGKPAFKTKAGSAINCRSSDHLLT